jgi:DNA segregation ATPase FtsK/SpoIIIE, S-DNA-T family
LGTTTPTTTFFDNVTTVLSDRQRELMLLVCLFGCTFSMLALLGYDPLDPTFLTPGEGAVANPCGPVGALLADVLFRLVGHGAWIMFLAMIFSVMSLAGRTRVDWAVGVASGTLYLALLPLMELTVGPGEYFPPGGLVGQMESGLLEATVGRVGAWLGLLGVAGLSITVLGNIRWTQVASRGVEAAEDWLPRAGEVARRG